MKRRKDRQEKISRVRRRTVVDRLKAFLISPGGSAMVIAVVGLLAYSNTFQSAFHYDDETSIVSNEAIHQLNNLGAIWKYSPTRFLTYLTFALNYYFHALDVVGYHVVNVLLHLGAALCCWWLLRLTFVTPALAGKFNEREGPWLALVGGLIFVAHPIQTQAVTYIVQRATVLAALCYLASLCWYIKARLSFLARASTIRILFSAIACILFGAMAFFSKEIAVTLPAAIFLYEIYFFRSHESTFYKYLLVGVFVFAAGLGVIFALDWIPSTDIEGVTRGQYLLTQFRVIAAYVRLLFLPTNQNVDYDIVLSKSFFDYSTFLSFIFLGAILLLSIRAFKKYRVLSFGIVGFFLALVPESSVIPIRDVLVEHRLYLPMASFAIVVVGATHHFVLPRHFRFASIALIVVLLLSAGATFKRNEVWKNEVTLWTDAVNKSPNKPRVWNNRGRALLTQGSYDWAMRDFDRAILLDPLFGDAYTNRGNIFLHRGEYEKALSQYQKALDVGLSSDQSYNALYYNLGTAYLHQGSVDEAIKNFNEAIRIEPNDPTYYYNRALAYAGKGDRPKSLSDYTEALRLNPRYSKALNNRGALYEELGKPDSAYADYTNALRSDSGYLQAYVNRGILNIARGNYEEAIDDLSRAIARQPVHPEAYLRRGVAFLAQKQYDNARKDFGTAIQQNPFFAEAYYQRGMLELAEGKKEAAERDFRQASSLGFRQSIK